MIRIYFSVLSGAVLLLFFLFINKYINYFQLQSFISGIILNLINTLLAYILFKKSLKRNNKQFLILVFGGMTARLFLLLTLFTLIIILLKIDKYAFIFTFLILYFVSLIWEISVYLKEFKKIRFN